MLDDGEEASLRQLSYYKTVLESIKQWSCLEVNCFRNSEKLERINRIKNRLTKDVDVLLKKRKTILDHPLRRGPYITNLVINVMKSRES